MKFEIRSVAGPLRAVWLLPLLLVGAGLANAATPLPSGGTLYIEFGDNDQIRWDHDNDSGTMDDIVPIDNLRDLGGFGPPSQTDCVLALDGVNATTSDLLSFSSAGTLGFNDTKDEIGIREQKRGVDCGRVTRGQSITLALEVAFKAVRSQIGLTVKKNVIVEGRFSVDGGTAEVIEIRTGNSVVDGIGHPPPGETDPSRWDASGPVNSLIYNCNPFSDSGSDNDASCVISDIPLIWDTLELATVGPRDGEFALGASSSIFELASVSGTLFCGETTITALDTATGAFGELRRLENPEETEFCGACEAIPYSLTWNGNTLEFIADYEGSTTTPQYCAAFEFNIAFAPYSIAADRPATPVVAQEPLPDPPPDPDPFLSTVTGQLEDLRIVQQFLPTDPEYYLDTCVGTPVFHTANGPGTPPAYLAGDLQEMDFTGVTVPDLSGGLPGTQYGCWLDLNWKYGVDAIGTDSSGDPDPTEPPDGIIDPDYIQLLIRGYLQGDWATRFR